MEKEGEKKPSDSAKLNLERRKAKILDPNLFFSFWDALMLSSNKFE